MVVLIMMWMVCRWFFSIKGMVVLCIIAEYLYSPTDICAAMSLSMRHCHLVMALLVGVKSHGESMRSLPRLQASKYCPYGLYMSSFGGMPLGKSTMRG